MNCTSPRLHSFRTNERARCSPSASASAYAFLNRCSLRKASIDYPQRGQLPRFRAAMQQSVRSAQRTPTVLGSTGIGMRADIPVVLITVSYFTIQESVPWRDNFGAPPTTWTPRHRNTALSRFWPRTYVDGNLGALLPHRPWCPIAGQPFTERDDCAFNGSSADSLVAEYSDRSDVSRGCASAMGDCRAVHKRARASLGHPDPSASRPGEHHRGRRASGRRCLW